MLELSLYIILFAGIFFLLWTFIGYPLFLVTFSLFLKKKHYIHQGYYPKVTMMIMTYNEEKAIAKKIENTLEIDYPDDRLEIFIVDSASTDKTQEIVREFEKKTKEKARRIMLAAQPKREGKASGINFGLKRATGEIIMITDGNAMLNKESVKNIARHFDDGEVGGVCGKFMAKDTKGTSTGSGGDIYWRIESILRRGESNLDSCIHMSGEITAFRKNLAAEADTTQLSEDFDMAVSIRKKGYRIIYEPQATAYEPAPTNVTDLTTQKRRITIGTLQVLSKHRSMLFNPRYGLYGIFILPGHKLFQLLSPFFLFFILISNIILFFFYHNLFVHYLFVMQATGYIFAGLSFLLASSDIFKGNKILNFTKYFFVTNWILVLGWIDFLRGKKIVTWKKIEGTREI